MASSGLPALDNLLGGGYPERSAILVEGLSSNDKEAIGYDFISSGIRVRNSCVYVTRLSKSEVVTDAGAFGINLERGTIWVCPEGGDSNYVPDDLANISYQIKGILRENFSRKIRIVFDLLSQLLMSNSNDSVYRFVGQLLTDLKKYDATFIAIVQEDMHQTQTLAGLELLFDGVLSVRRSGNANVEVHVKKMRGAKPVILSALIPLGTDSMGGPARPPREVQGQRRLAAVMFTDMVGFTALTQSDEAQSLAVLERHNKLLRPFFSKFHGREVKTIGDSFLVEFDSALDATNCAVEIQRFLHDYNISSKDEWKITLRIGIHLGDVVHSGRDVFGDAVNIASRLQPLAEPEGVCVSDQVYGQVRNKIPQTLAKLEPHDLKGVKFSIDLYRVVMPWERAVAATGFAQSLREVQRINFCAAHDGARIAYAVTGEGSPLVKTATWLSHLEFDFESPVWRHWITELSRHNSYIRYDERGCGLSDQNPPEFSFGAWVSDLETVVDSLQIDRFDLLGVSQGGAVAVDYAVRHPERINHLILYGAYARGWGKRVGLALSPEEVETRQAMHKLMELGWGQDNPAFRQMFTSLFLPDGGLEQQRWFNELQRVSCSPQNAARFDEIFSEIDVADLLPRVSVPTLIMHARQDGVVPFEAGRLMASRIPGARFVSFEGRNHILQETEPGWQVFLRELRQFIGTPSK